MSAPAPAAGARTYVPLPRKASLPSIVAEFPISPFESFIASISERPDGRRVAAICRVKRVNGELRRMSAFEFGEHRLLAVSSLIDELARAVAKRNGG